MSLPIESVTIRNLLSFGPDADKVELRPLNVLIGPNGSGKSNFIESLGLLASMPHGLKGYINNNGGILHWLWKGAVQSDASLEVTGTIRSRESTAYNHSISVSHVNQFLQVDDEWIAFSDVRGRRPRKPLFAYERGVPILRLTRKKILEHADIDRTESAIWRDQPSELLVALDPLSRFYRSFRFYRGRSLNHAGPAKQAQALEQFNEYLVPDARNLGAVLNRMILTNTAREVVNQLKLVNDSVDEILVSVESGTLQLYLREVGLLLPIPASRISDGTFRWLCLIAILLGPSPPPLMCIEEPDVGLHPDVVVELAGLLKKASTRTQLIVTTHSDTLVDALSDTPESILVCEKYQGQTSLRRLSETNLHDWLADYGLGQLWRRGDLGGESVLSVTIYVEGGGDDNLTKTNCRKGFRKFIEKMLPGKDMPTIVACQSRSRALKDFQIALRNLREGDQAFLLVDSEAPVAPESTPWKHFKDRKADEWEKPEGAQDDQALMMVQCMESWFLADREAVAAWYDDQNFRISKLPPLHEGSIEPIEKERVAKGLKEATELTTKKTYHKTKHGFALLERIEPKKVRKASKHAEKLFQTLDNCLKDRPTSG